MSNNRGKRIKKRNGDKNESFDDFISGNDAILSAFRFSRQNKVSLSLCYPEYFKPTRLHNSALPKTRISTFKAKLQHTVGTNPHCWIVFSPEAVYQKTAVSTLETNVNKPDAIGNTTAVSGLEGFDEMIILSSFLKINFTRTTSAYFEIAPGEFNPKLTIGDFDEKQKLGDDFIYRYVLPNYNFEFKKEQLSGKCSVIHLYGLENGLVLDMEIVITFQATASAACNTPYEFKKTTLRKNTHSYDMRMLKRLFENRKPELINTPLKNPMNGVLELPHEMSVDASFLFPDKNAFEIRNTYVVANFETDGKNIYSKDVDKKEHSNKIIITKDNKSIMTKVTNKLIGFEENDL